MYIAKEYILCCLIFIVVAFTYFVFIFFVAALILLLFYILSNIFVGWSSFLVLNREVLHIFSAICC